MSGENEKKEIEIDISSRNTSEEPETVFDMVNKYGTYNIQPTAVTENLFPQIAHGTATEKKKSNDKDLKKQN